MERIQRMKYLLPPILRSLFSFSSYLFSYGIRFLGTYLYLRRMSGEYEVSGQPGYPFTNDSLEPSSYRENI